MEVIGKIKVLNLNQQVSATYTKSEVVVTTEEQFPQHISIEFGGQKHDLLDPYKVGDEVKVHINLRGREWVSPQGETKYFNSLQGWRIEKIQGAPAIPPAAEQNIPTYNGEENEGDDLLF
jgi:translation initiation factor IF-3